MYHWLVVSTHLKNISQIGNLPQTGVKIKSIWNNHLDHLCGKNRVSRHASEGWPCWIACRLTQATNAQGATVHCLGQRPGIWVMTRPCTLWRWSKCSVWGGLPNHHKLLDDPYGILIPTKDPQNSSRSRVHHRCPKSKNLLKCCPQKRHPQFLLLDLAFLRGKNIQYVYLPKNHSFHPSIQELLSEVGISKISQRNFCSGDFQRYNLFHAANISWRRFRWGVISWRRFV